MSSELNDHMVSYESKKEQLLKDLKTSKEKNLSLKKKTASNLFRYMHANQKPKKAFAIRQFDTIISLDKENGILNVEGLTPYEKIVDYTLQHGFLPTVAPELKHITVGGAIVGIGIESTSYKYGFVHDGVLEVEVLLPDGKIVLCNPHNEYADLFFGLPNSYGTLGYILRAKIKLYRAYPFVHIKVQRFNDVTSFMEAMQKATLDPAIQFVEGLVFSNNEFYLSLGNFISQLKKLDDIYRENIFYKMVQDRRDIYLTTEDYIFRYDPDWFWNIPETKVYNVFRQIAPKALRNSGFYKKYIDYKKKCLTWLGMQSSSTKNEETLIQDWEVSWEKGQDLLDFALQNIDLNGKPWAVVPIMPQNQVFLFPLKPNRLYLNLGCYCSSKRTKEYDSFYNTKIMDTHCFELGGLKMLYSSTMLSAKQFANLYNGEAYQSLKQKYDSKNLSGTLYDKVVCPP